MATTDPNEKVTISHPDIVGTAQRTRKQFAALRKKGWRLATAADIEAAEKAAAKGSD